MSKNKKDCKEKTRSLWKDFKAFISKGSVLDMAVGVIIGGAFSAIVTAVVNILLSLCTWGVPGGIKGLVTVLPALNSAQAGVDGIGQTFTADKYLDALTIFQSKYGATADMSKYYIQHGDIYYWYQSAIIDWGTLINAIISFLIIATVLFIIVKVAATLKQRKAEFDAKMLEDYYTRHPEERPAPVEEAAPQPTETELLVQIRDLLKEKKQ